MTVITLGAVIDIIGGTAPRASSRTGVALVPGGLDSKGIVEVAAGTGRTA